MEDFEVVYTRDIDVKKFSGVDEILYILVKKVPVYCQEIGLVALLFFFELLFSYVSSQFPSMFLLLTYSQSFFSLSADYPRHSRQRRSKIPFD